MPIDPDHDFDLNEFPAAYLLTFRTFGSWFHGDQRLSVGRQDFNIYGTPRIAPNIPLEDAMKASMKENALF